MNQPLTRQSMIEHLRRALNSPASNDQEAWLEDIALLAQGRGDDLTPSRRSAVLDALASDPVLAQLLADAVVMFAQAHQPMQGGAAREARRLIFPQRVLGVGFALAACLTLMFGVWRLADPPAPLSIGQDGRVEVLSHAPGQPDYWAQYEQQQLKARAQRDQYRDYALIGFAGLSVALGLATVGMGIMLAASRRSKPVSG